MDSLLSVWSCTCEHIQVLDRQILAHARTDAVCRRFMTAPGIGPVTALAYRAIADDPGRFKNSSSVGAYLRTLHGVQGQHPPLDIITRPAIGLYII